MELSADVCVSILEHNIELCKLVDVNLLQLLVDRVVHASKSYARSGNVRCWANDSDSDDTDEDTLEQFGAAPAAAASAESKESAPVASVEDQQSAAADLLRVLAAAATAGSEPVLSNQQHIIRILSQGGTNGSVEKHTMRLYRRPHSEAYQRRLQLMAGADPMSDTDLRYHIELLLLLSDCCAGGINIAEVKCQTLYPHRWALHAVLDERTIWNVRAPLLKYVYEVSLECKNTITGLAEDTYILGTLELFASVLSHVEPQAQLKGRPPRGPWFRVPRARP